MRVYLVQHAHALPEEVDPERPLSPEGREAASRVAAFLARVGLQPAQIHHSGKTRARQTAEIFAEALRVPEVVESPGLAPKDDPAIWAERLGREPRPLMLVGHLPHLARLTGLLLTGDPDRRPVAFRNAGVVCLERSEGGEWSLLWAVVPEVLPA